jgi:hypothetical protein
VAWDTWRAGSATFTWLGNSAIVYARYVDGQSQLVRVDIDFEGPHPRIADARPLLGLDKVKACPLASSTHLSPYCMGRA